MNLVIPLMGTIHIGLMIAIGFTIKGTVLLFSVVFPLTYVKIK